MEGRPPHKYPPAHKIFNASAEKHFPTNPLRPSGFPVYEQHLFLRENEKRQAIDKRVTGKRFRQRFGAHPSEHEWKVEKTHPRHLLNFPTEILNRILSFALVAPCEVTPLAVSYDSIFWTIPEVDSREEFQTPSYFLGSTGPKHEYYGFSHTPSISRAGECSYSGWHRNPIDATVLRVCKLLYQEGLPLLYGENEFVFDVNDDGLPYMLQYTALHDVPKPHLREHTRPKPMHLESKEVQQEISKMFNLRNPRDLPDWICCDPFTRFLYSIGPIHASFIRNLRIVGTLFSDGEYSFGKLHGSSRGNLRYFLKAYAPFISLYLPNIEKFGIGVDIFGFKNFLSISENGSWLIANIEQQNWYLPDPEDQDVQEEDVELGARIGEDAMKTLRVSREENRLKKKAKTLLNIENSMATKYLMPILDKMVPKMEKLRKLEVRRREILAWDDSEEKKIDPQDLSLEFPAPTSEITWDPSIDRWGRPTQPWVGIEIAEGTKQAVVIAAYKRSQELKAAEQMKALTLQGSKETPQAAFTSQLDLPDHPSLSDRSGQNSRGGTRGPHGTRGRNVPRQSDVTLEKKPESCSQSGQVTVAGDSRISSNTERGGKNYRVRGGRDEYELNCSTKCLPFPGLGSGRTASSVVQGTYPAQYTSNNSVATSMNSVANSTIRGSTNNGNQSGTGRGRSGPRSWADVAAGRF